MTDDIVAFIRERLDERANADWHARTCQTHQAMPPGTPFGLAGSPMSCNCGVPDRVLRGVEAKLRLIDEHAAERYEYPRRGGEPIGEPHCHSCVTDRDQYEPEPDAFPCLTLRIVATEWSTHADYRSEWTP